MLCANCQKTQPFFLLENQTNEQTGHTMTCIISLTNMHHFLPGRSHGGWTSPRWRRCHPNEITISTIDPVYHQELDEDTSAGRKQTSERTNEGKLCLDCMHSTSPLPLAGVLLREAVSCCSAVSTYQIAASPPRHFLGNNFDFLLFSRLQLSICCLRLVKMLP